MSLLLTTLQTFNQQFNKTRRKKNFVVVAQAHVSLHNTFIVDLRKSFFSSIFFHYSILYYVGSRCTSTQQWLKHKNRFEKNE